MPRSRPVEWKNPGIPSTNASEHDFQSETPKPNARLCYLACPGSSIARYSRVSAKSLCIRHPMCDIAITNSCNIRHNSPDRGVHTTLAKQKGKDSNDRVHGTQVTSHKCNSGNQTVDGHQNSTRPAKKGTMKCVGG